MSFLENFKLKENKLFESSLSSNKKTHKRYSSVKSENEIFDENSIKSLASNCNGSTRYLNNLIEKSLMICCNQKSKL